ncbi:hypothetical protein [Pseudomonas fluorescens]|uniref:Transmembrane protein n=2 Tax=Pseudomonas fluorescens TaxID=294 RepID=A0A5E6UEV9_PSEFL|nr:hypothetical protein PS624_03456 [Pseudomonas fluorescens]
MKGRVFDWKFILTLTVAILGIVVPLVWQSDLSSKSMELRLSSSTSLEPPSKILDLQVVLDGKKLETPYSSSLELVNTGSKTVLSSDFDKPIEILIGDGAKLVTARITDTTPNDIPAEISLSGNVIRIAPHLSNPKDAISLSIITSGEKPVYSTRGRIAGIQHIPYTDLTLPKPIYIRYLKSVINGVAGWGLLCVTVLFSFVHFDRPEFGVPKVVSLFIGLVSYVGAVQLVGSALSGLVLRNQWGIFIPIAVISTTTAIAACLFLLRRWNRQAH